MQLSKVLILTTLISLETGCVLLPGRLKDNFYDDLGPSPLGKNVGHEMLTCSDNKISDQNCFNFAVTRVMQESSKQCVDHMKTIYGNDAAWNISSGTFATFTSGWAAISSGGQAKLLSALSAFSNGERSLVNETIYKNQVTSSIGIKISEMREEKGNAIRVKLGSSTYTVAQAEFDLLDYHNSCSFYAGLQKALKEGTDNSPALKLSNLMMQRDHLIAQISLYTTSKNMVVTDADKNKSDPVYKSMIDELSSLDTSISLLRSPNTKQN